MARIRTIKPEFWKHEDLSAVSEATHMLAAALLNYADDYGYFNANPKLVKAECCPLREPSVSIPESLRSLQELGYIRIGTGPEGRRYGHIVEFEKHQRVSHPSPSKIRDLPITWDVLQNAPEKFVSPPETFAPEQGTGNREHDRPDAVASPVLSDQETLWQQGVPWLAKRSGKPPDKVRGVVGKWAKQHGAPRVLEAIALAQQREVIEPIAFITAALSERQKDDGRFKLTPLGVGG